MNYVDIALCFDEKIAKHACVTIKSIISSKRNENYIYRIHCVTKGRIKNLIKDYIDELLGFYGDQVHILFYELEANQFEGAYEIRNITSTTYFRLMLPEILQNLDRVIYMDIDVVVCDDLDQLFEMNLENMYLRAVKCMLNSKAEWKIHRERFFTEEFDKCAGYYVNAGVLLMNLAEIRKSNLVTKWKKLVYRNYNFQDQDIINLTCYEKIGFLPLKYNMLMGQRNVSIENLIDEKIYSQEEVNDALYNPVIIHFAGYKPWMSVIYDRCDMTKKWWNYVLEDKVLTEWFKESLLECMSFDQAKYQKANRENQILRRILSLTHNKDVLLDKLLEWKCQSVAVYGMGVVGKYIYKLLLDMPIKVCYGIDRAARAEENITIYKPNEDLPPVDVIIVTVFHDGKEVMTALNEKVSCAVILLEDLMKIE